MANTIKVTIIGLGRVGASIGLALKRYNQKPNAIHQFQITGVEHSAGILEDAQKLNAVDKTGRNLYSAVENQDIVVLACGYADMRETYHAIGNNLRSGAVVLDFSPLKTPSIEWAKNYLAEDVHMVGVSAIFNPRYLHDGLDDTLHATADFFDNGSILLMPTPTCIREAVQLASDFATLLGAGVHFADPQEYDTLAAATHSLPTILGVAAFYMLSSGSGWSDIQRVTNPPFGRLTHSLFDTHPDDLRDLWLNNRDNNLRYLDQMLDTLNQMRDALARNDRDAIESVLSNSSEKYSTWINKRHNSKWEDNPPSSIDNPSSSETLMSSLVGGKLAKRLRGGK